MHFIDETQTIGLSLSLVAQFVDCVGCDKMFGHSTYQLKMYEIVGLVCEIQKVEYTQDDSTVIVVNKFTCR